MELSEFDACALLAMLVYGEARNQDVAGQIAVANVPKNRVFSHIKWWSRKQIDGANTWKGVILKKCQFSCFLDDDPNLPKMLKAWENRETDEAMRQAACIAKGVIERELKDNSNGATHYHTAAIHPFWAKGETPVAHIEDHIFYRIM